MGVVAVFLRSLVANLNTEITDTGEADGKAGAYAIQGAAGAFVSEVNGSVTNVIGLPLAETLALLRRVVT